MKANRFIVLGVILSVVMSAAALAIQVRKEITTGFFGRFSNPLKISEMEYRKFYGQFLMITDYIPADKGFGVPEIGDLSEDGNTLIISVGVYPSELPKSFEERKSNFRLHAISALNHLKSAYDLEFPDLNPHIEVRFIDYFGNANMTAKLMSEGRELKPDIGVVAIFKNGQLTMR